MRKRRFFVPGTLLVSIFAGAVFAGQYQRTRDETTLVWNEDHKSGDWVSWSGKSDADGYATGYGILTWYGPEDTPRTRSNVSRPRYRVLSSVSGTMVHGKFAEAPAPAMAQAPAEASKPKNKGWLSSIFQPRPRPTPAPLVEATPRPSVKPSSPQIEERSEKSTPVRTNAATNPTPTPRSSPSTAGDSLDTLMHAPSSLKLDSPTASPTPATTPNQ